eukprot:TRINITY_DN29268_c0_g2_i1.p1 TRINITY_DN29268_c0_g2~~TRINITY_DN29268_c0_g2_i1.p1  ORF type:complete len:484 (+),score=106.88 TRINITY_DN29268_c0_g2_i1:89-1540(+)
MASQQPAIPEGSRCFRKHERPVLFALALALFLLVCFATLAKMSMNIVGNHEPWQPGARKEVPCKTLAAASGGSPMLLLTSNGVSNSELQHALRELVLKLPGSSWANGDGAARKERARKRDLNTLASSNFYEPDLYSGLDVLVLEDSCLPKDSFWNPANPSFNDSTLINHQKVGTQKSRSLVEPFFGKGLDGGSCSDWSSTKSGGLGPLGFEEERFHHFSFFDSMLPDEDFVRFLELQTSRWSLGQAARKDFKRLFQGLQADASSAAAADFVELAEKADLLILNGGNPDLSAYIYGKFAAPIIDAAFSRLLDGEMVLMGRSSGSMVSSADVGLSYEPNPLLLDVLLGNRTEGLSFTPDCAHRPHFKDSWDVPIISYERLTGLKVVRTRDGEALRCAGGECAVVGGGRVQRGPALLAGVRSFLPAETYQRLTGDSKSSMAQTTSVTRGSVLFQRDRPAQTRRGFFTGPDDERLIRLTNAFASKVG